MQTHSLQFGWNLRCRVFVNNCAHAARIGVVQMADEKMGEIDGKDSVVDWNQSQLLSDKRFSDKSLATSPANLSVASDPPHRISRWVLNRRQRLGKGSRTPLVELRRRFVAKSFVWSHLIVSAQPLGRAVLL